MLFNSIMIAQKYSDRHQIADSNLIVKNDWGVYFTKCSNWRIISNTSNKITLTQTTGESSGDLISIDYVLSDSITDNDAKFGSITYFYDKKKNAWMETDNMEGENIYAHSTPVLAEDIAILADGFPVFKGTYRWKTITISLSHTTFLKCNITGGGLTDALLLITGTIRKIN